MEWDAEDEGVVVELGELGLIFAVTHFVTYWVVTPAPFAVGPVCSWPFPNPDHVGFDGEITPVYALKTHTSER